MYEALVYLVGIHAQVTSVAEALLDRILNALVNELAEEALRCFRQVKRFGMGGMLRVCVLQYQKELILMDNIGNA
jgi:exocyst complex component 2